MPDDAMDKLEPFNYNELTAFSMPYLSGYLSEDIIIRSRPDTGEGYEKS